MSTLIGTREARARDRSGMGRAETKVTRLFAEHRTVAGLPSVRALIAGRRLGAERRPAPPEQPLAAAKCQPRRKQQRSPRERRLAAQFSMKRTFRIASIHRASRDAVRASCRIGTTVFGALLAPLAPGRRPCRFSLRTGLIKSHHGSRQTLVAEAGKRHPCPWRTGHRSLHLLPQSHQNHLLDALPSSDFERIASHLELIPLKLGDVLYESGSRLRYVYFPTTSIISLLYVMEDGASAKSPSSATKAYSAFPCSWAAIQRQARRSCRPPATVIDYPASC